VIGILRHTINRKILIKQHLEAQRPVVNGDPTQLQNAVMNIALNARDAMPEGGELLFTTTVTLLDASFCDSVPFSIRPGSYLQLTISDTGSGMDSETQKKIFEPFFSTKEQGKGTGMGLASVYGTIKNHNGAIEVNSKPGRGTTFTISLPHNVTEVDTKQPVDEKSVAVSDNAHILLVDDEDIVITVTETMLKKCGYRVTSFRNGAEALAFFRAHWQSVDLVLLDMIMPQMSGSEAFGHIKKINPHVRVLLNSGYSIDGEAQQILDEGATNFVQKPFRRTELTRKIEEVLKR
jgi:CheY-like chemotaxis protein